MGERLPVLEAALCDLLVFAAFGHRLSDHCHSSK